MTYYCSGQNKNYGHVNAETATNTQLHEPRAVMASWWRQRGAEGVSDFRRKEAEGPVSLLQSVAVETAAPVGAVAGVTFALAFTEGCLHLEHRPIPLRFAARYALYNVVPSAVWTTVPADAVATASNLALERLVTTPPSTADPNLPVRARRILDIKALRTLRYLAGSYGLVWSLWRWHEAWEQRRAAATEDDTPLERVVRVGSATSALAKLASARHGDHILNVPWEYARRRPYIDHLIDWSTVGLYCRTHDGSAADPLKVIELEIDDQAPLHTRAIAQIVADARDDGSRAHTVGVVAAAAHPAWHHDNGVDVYFFELSSVVRFLSGILSLQDDKEMVLLDASTLDDIEDDQETPAKHSPLVGSIYSAMVHHHGVPNILRVESMEEPTMPFSENAAVVIVGTTKSEAERLASKLIEEEIALASKIVIICQASVQTASKKASETFSIADATDRVLQDIRERFRAGQSAAAIQDALYEKFGAQSALLHQADALSDLSRAI